MPAFHTPIRADGVKPTVPTTMAGLLAAGIFGFLSGCAGDGRTAQDNAPEMVFRHLQNAGHVPWAAQDLSLVILHRLDFPGEADFSHMKALLETAGLSPQELTLWREHGLDAGTLPVKQWQMMLLQLPPWLQGWESRQIAGESPLPLPIAPPLDDGNTIVAVPRTGADDGPPQPISLEGGRLQFLLRVRRVQPHQFLLELVPHHNRVSFSIEPKPPDQRDLEGPSFPSLRLLCALSQDRLLVVMPHDHMDASSPENVLLQPPGSDGHVFSRHWGRLLLSYRHSGKPVQTLLVIQVLDFFPMPPDTPGPGL